MRGRPAAGGVKIDGDSFFVTSRGADTVAAIAACVQGQRGLTSEPWPVDARIRVRMGMHTASPHAPGRLHRAGRAPGGTVINAGGGVQILVSTETAERTRAGTGSGWALTTLGHYPVRDFDDPVELFQVMGRDLPDDFPLRVLPADRHNLVRAATTESSSRWRPQHAGRHSSRRPVS